MTDIHPWTLLICCILATFWWRAIGVTIASHINPDGKMFQWFNCVAYALLSGLITRILIAPVGTLDDSTLAHRSLAILIGFCAFFFFKRSIIAGTITSFIIFLILGMSKHFGSL